MSRFAPFAMIDEHTIDVRIDDRIQILLVNLAGQLRELLLIDDGDEIRRLYPTAYPDDDHHEKDYRAMVHDKLLMARLDAIEALEATIDAETITTEQADQWMSTINEIRLVLGTKLDVREDDDGLIDLDDPDAAGHQIYALLSSLLDALTDVRSLQL